MEIMRLCVLQTDYTYTYTRTRAVQCKLVRLYFCVRVCACMSELLSMLMSTCVYIYVRVIADPNKYQTYPF